MSTMRRLLATLAVVVAALAGVTVIGVAPAAAHDQLVSSSPAKNEHLAVAPSEVTLTFSDDVLVFEGMGAVVRISDTEGGTWQKGDAITTGTVVTSAVDPAMPDGAFTLAWQVVSADGHAISGVIPFTVGDVVAAPVATSSSPSTSVATADAPSVPFSPVLRTVLIGVGGALVALALAWAVSRAFRRSSTRKP